MQGGDANVSGVYRQGGAAGVSATCAAGTTPNNLTIAGGIVTSAGACTGIGASAAIQNGTSPQTADFNITGGGVIGGTLNVSGLSTLGSLTVSGVATFNGTLTVNAAATFNGTLTVNGHIITGGSTPGIAANAAAGTGASVGITGNDTAGTITITTGTIGLATGSLATITFATAYGATPVVTMSPTNASAAMFATYLTPTTASFDINAAVAPGISTTYTYTYHVVQ